MRRAVYGSDRLGSDAASAVGERPRERSVTGPDRSVGSGCNPRMVI